jgi:hypothetical protein
MAAHHSDKKALEILAREIAPAGTGMGMSCRMFVFTFAVVVLKLNAFSG